MRAGLKIAFLSSAFALYLAACGSDGGDLFPGTTASTTTGAGGATSSTSATGGAGPSTTTSGTGQGGQMGPCVVDTDCPAPGSECVSVTCNEGTCAYEFLPQGTPVSGQIPGDCKEIRCNGAGNVTTVDVADDPSDDGNDCTDDVCKNGLGSHPPSDAGSPCAGGVCNGGGACVGCLDASDCDTGSCGFAVCAANVCRGQMVDVGTGCIDRTEVTNDEYLEFLGGPKPALPAECAWNASYIPSGGTPPQDGKPVTGVDWCDAWSYCASIGKTLCGKPDGSPTNPQDFVDPQKDAWFAACSNGGSTQFPYGDAFQPQTCNGGPSGLGSPYPVPSTPDCHGAAAPYDGVFDLSGNVWEWEASCGSNNGSGDPCRVRGGSYNNDESTLRCDTDYTLPRNGAYGSVGLRCCAP